MTNVLDKIKNQKNLVQNLQDSLFVASGPSVEELLKSPEFLEIATYLKSKKIPLDDSKAIDKALKEYKATMTNLPKLRVEVARKDINTENLFNWFYENLMNQKLFILDIDENPNLIGGLVVYWQGKVVDLSLKKKLQNFYLKEVPHVFR